MDESDSTVCPSGSTNLPSKGEPSTGFPAGLWFTCGCKGATKGISLRSSQRKAWSGLVGCGSGNSDCHLFVRHYISQVLVLQLPRGDELLKREKFALLPARIVEEFIEHK